MPISAIDGCTEAHWGEVLEILTDVAELGIRLAFDKPTIIIKDDCTTYSFDTAPIEHLSYPRDLRFTRIIDFKETLKEKLEATHEKETKDPTYTTFLKHFGEFLVVKLEEKRISGQDFILEELKSIQNQLRKIEIKSYTSRRPRSNAHGLYKKDR